MQEGWTVLLFFAFQRRDVSGRARAHAKPGSSNSASGSHAPFSEAAATAR